MMQQRRKRSESFAMAEAAAEGASAAAPPKPTRAEKEVRRSTRIQQRFQQQPEAKKAHDENDDVEMHSSDPQTQPPPPPKEEAATAAAAAPTAEVDEEGKTAYERLREGRVLRNRAFLLSMRADTDPSALRPPAPKRRASVGGGVASSSGSAAAAATTAKQYALRERSAAAAAATTTDSARRAASKAYARWEPRRSWAASKQHPRRDEAARVAAGAAPERLLAAIDGFADLTRPEALTADAVQPLVALNARVLRHPLRAGRAATCHQPYLLAHFNSTKECWVKNGCRVIGHGRASAADVGFDWPVFKDLVRDLLLSFTTMHPALVRALPEPSETAAADCAALLARMPYLGYLGESPDDVAATVWALFATMPRALKLPDPPQPATADILWMLAHDLHPWFSRAGVSVPLPWERFFHVPLIARDQRGGTDRCVTTAIALLFFSFVCSRAFCMDATLLMQARAENATGDDDDEDGDDDDEDDES